VEEQLAFEKSIEEGTLTKEKLINLSYKQIKTFLTQYSTHVDNSLKGLREEDLTILNHSYQTFKPVLERVTKLKNISTNALDRIPETDLEAGHLYILVADYLQEMAGQAMELIESNLNHVDNNHKPLLPEQLEELLMLNEMLTERYQTIIELYKDHDHGMVKKLYDHINSYINIIRNVRKKQIKRIKNHEVGTRNSALFLSHLAELRNLGLFSNLVVRVYAELILDPEEEVEFSVEKVKSELKQLRKEVKIIKAEADAKRDIKH
jgi:hypothetical protein